MLGVNPNQPTAIMLCWLQFNSKGKQKTNDLQKKYIDSEPKFRVLQTFLCNFYNMKIINSVKWKASLSSFLFFNVWKICESYEMIFFWSVIFLPLDSPLILNTSKGKLLSKFFETVRKALDKFLAFLSNKDYKFHLFLQTNSYFLIVLFKMKKGPSVKMFIAIGFGSPKKVTITINSHFR